MTHLMYRRMISAVAMLVSVFLYGTVGHYLLLDQRFSLGTCAYRTILMLGTINEAFTAEQIGNLDSTIYRGFELSLVIFGIAVILYSLSTITAFFVEGELQEMLRMRKMSKEIAKMKGHFIICGGGETGHYIANELKQSHRDFLIVESAASRCERLRSEGHRYVQGNALEDDVLEEAGIRRAAGIIAALPSDPDNLFVTLSARQLNPSLRIIAKGEGIHSDKKLLMAGADSVVRPAAIGGLRMAGELIRPTVVSFIDRLMRDPEIATRIEEIRIHDGCPLYNQTIAGSQFRQKTGLQVLAVAQPGENQFCFRPEADTRLEAGTTLIVMGHSEDVDKARVLSGMEPAEEL